MMIGFILDGFMPGVFQGFHWTLIIAGCLALCIVLKAAKRLPTKKRAQLFLWMYTCLMLCIILVKLPGQLQAESDIFPMFLFGVSIEIFSCLAFLGCIAADLFLLLMLIMPKKRFGIIPFVSGDELQL